MTFMRKHVLGLEDFTREELFHVLHTAINLREINTRPVKKVPALRGKTVLNAFFENSTRTKMSFEMAEKRLSADTYGISNSGSSTAKGETLVDTVRNIQAMKIDLVVMRHRSSGAHHFLAKHVDVPIINAGDGWHEHPTQALLDALTMYEHKKNFEGLNVAIVGDITHSRVAHSNIYALSTLGANVRLCGPFSMMPRFVEKLGNVTICPRIEQALEGADVVMMLRIQLERMPKHLFPSNREYAMYFGLNRERIRLTKEDAIIMHPGPINRGVEMTFDVADHPERSVILEQVHNGVAVRMALLYLLLGGGATA